MKKTPELFNQRNTQTKQIEFTYRRNVSVDVGEIWWYYEGINIGSEISKNSPFKRPCLILHTGIEYGLILIAPLTTQYNDKHKNHRIHIKNRQNIGIKESWIVVSQIKPISSKRIVGILSTKKNHTLCQYVLNQRTTLINNKKI